MKNRILLSIGTGLAFGLITAATAQVAGGPPGGVPTGGVRSQDVAAANRQQDEDYNTLAGRGVKVTNKDRERAAATQVKHGTVVRATAADVKPGEEIRDIKGAPVGKVATLAANEVVADPSQVVVDTGKTKIGVPLSAFGKDDKGLLMSITADKFNQLVAQAEANKPAAPASN